MGREHGSVPGPPVKLLDNGADDRRLVLVLLAEGFQETEQARFESSCDAFVRKLQDEVWYGDRSAGVVPYPGRAINVYRLNVASDDSGIEDPLECGGTGAAPNTFFDVTHCPVGVGGRKPRRVIGSRDDFHVLDTLNNHVPAWDSAILLANTTELGGSTLLLTSTAFVSLHKCWLPNIMHELGHLLFGLGDEYEYLGRCETDGPEQSMAPPGEPMFPNVTAESDPLGLKWRDLVTSDVPVPTMANPDCAQCDDRPNVLDVFDLSHTVRAMQRIWFAFIRQLARISVFGVRPYAYLLDRCYYFAPDPDNTKVGLFEGANYFKCGNYRPAYRCKMRDQFAPYCPVCRQAIVDALRPYLS